MAVISTFNSHQPDLFIKSYIAYVTNEVVLVFSANLTKPLTADVDASTVVKKLLISLPKSSSASIASELTLDIVLLFVLTLPLPGSDIAFEEESCV